MNTDEYEGHTPGPWKVVAKANDYRTTDVVVGKTIVATNISGNDSSLIAAAPNLLAEVKRLTTMLNIAENNIPRSIHWDCYWEALVEAGLETIEDEDEWEEEE